MGVEGSELDAIAGRPASPGELPHDDRWRDDPSLVEDIEALIADGKTYLEAELRFQKTRVAFTGSRVKWAFFYGAAAFGFLHLALIGLVVGLVFALAPLTGPWLAILIVVAALFLAAFVFVSRLRTKLREIRSVFEDGQP